MDHAAYMLGVLAAMIAGAKLLGILAQRVGQPAVLGELVAGVLLGMSVAGVVDPTDEALHLLAELGVAILLFEIGLETDLAKLLKVGGAAAVVAVIGVVLPFALGYGVCRWLGYTGLMPIVVGATLTATSVGITARVLADLGRLHEPESQIVLGAAVIDDVVGLVILTVIKGMTGGEATTPTPLGVAGIVGMAVGFLIVAVLAGRLIVPPLVRVIARANVRGLDLAIAVVLTFGLAWLAAAAGSATIIGAFAAGLLARETVRRQQIEHAIGPLGHFLVPLFFVWVGAAVNVAVLNPADAENHATLQLAGLLLVVAVVGKFLAGYGPFWFRGKKHVIGIGMVPRGEVGLIFAGVGLASGVVNESQFAALTLVVMATTFLAPPLLKWTFPPLPGPSQEKELVEEQFDLDSSA